ncbi:hypothetical protein VTN49DRAFT_6820 [Thermomyces lanuginosus]|uniref:uncharacterized protein n=1 Tax=Thermomyces lanuginosus TaxID=5541 RepID=UPI003742D613
MEPSPYCKQLVLPHGISFNFILSLLILVGILASYLPQHVRIIRLRSSFGISPYFVLLGTTSGTSSFANILTLPKSARDVACCREISGLSCFSGLLGIFQVGTQCLSFYVILLLFVVFFPRDPAAAAATSDPLPRKQATYRTAIGVAIVCVVHALAVIITSIIVAATQPNHLQAWANFLGIMSATLASIQYFPQIYTTFRLQRVGSLSIPMMCIQTPGSLVWAASLAARLGTEGWSTWGVYVLTAILQGTLLMMAVYFEYLGPKKDIISTIPPSDDGEVSSEGRNGSASERTPLLADQQNQ